MSPFTKMVLSEFERHLYIKLESYDINVIALPSYGMNGSHMTQRVTHGVTRDPNSDIKTQRFMQKYSLAL